MAKRKPEITAPEPEDLAPAAAEGEKTETAAQQGPPAAAGGDAGDVGSLHATIRQVVNLEVRQLHVAVGPPAKATDRFRARAMAVGATGYAKSDWTSCSTKAVLAVDPGKVYRVSVQIASDGKISEWYRVGEVQVKRLAVLSKGPKA